MWDNFPSIIAFTLVLQFVGSNASFLSSHFSTCLAIQSAISPSSKVFFPGSLEYEKDISHWASSSSQESLCSVEPGTAQDVATVIKIIAANKKPFAVKGGGHTSNPGFSSTPGVQIAMYRFSDVVCDPSTMTVEVGAGLVWDDVYSALEPYGVNVVGGRVTGVGVHTRRRYVSSRLASRADNLVLHFVGYSWKSNQYGLTIDTVVAYELVVPNGDILTVNNATYPDLFFGLRGIVTKFTLKAFPQTQVYGGTIIYTEPQFAALNALIADFAENNRDPKASMLPTYNAVLGIPILDLILFYDAPTAPPGIFDAFLATPHFSMDVSTRSYMSLVTSAPSNATSSTRGSFTMVSVKDISVNIMEQVLAQTKYWDSHSLMEADVLISIDVEPFLPTYFDHSQGGAYPHQPSNPLYPVFLYFAWLLPESDSFFLNALKQSASAIYNEAVAEGQSLQGATIYGNYAPPDASIDQIWGGNVPTLQQIKSTWDPQDIMGLAGGFNL